MLYPWFFFFFFCFNLKTQLFHFAFNGRICTDNCQLCPHTMATLKEVDQMTNGIFNMTMGLTTFSILEPGTHIKPHNGPNNARIRCHFGLITPPGAFLRVGNEIRSWEKGKVRAHWLVRFWHHSYKKTFCFDDSFEHEAWNNGSSLRLVVELVFILFLLLNKCICFFFFFFFLAALF